MPDRCSIYISPAGTGKTAYALELARQAAAGLGMTPRIVVPTHLQARSARRRLAGMGGAIGVRVLTFDGLYAECLDAGGEVYLDLIDPVQYRLLQAVSGGVSLAHYASLAGRPGFIQALQSMVGELKAARIDPLAFAGAVQAMGDEPRLAELARIYAAYQERLAAGSSGDTQGWADRAGRGWLALEMLRSPAPAGEQRALAVGAAWPLVIVDGFDSFTGVQMALLAALKTRVGELIITLTADEDGEERVLAHRRFAKTRRDLEQALGVRATPLPSQNCKANASLQHLERHLFRPVVARYPEQSVVELVEVPDRASEARSCAALAEGSPRAGRHAPRRSGASRPVDFPVSPAYPPNRDRIWLAGAPGRWPTTGRESCCGRLAQSIAANAPRQGWPTCSAVAAGSRSLAQPLL